jgi:DnaJ homolog subfamily C member 28
MPKADDQIRRAMEEGQFEDLPGKGRPLKLDENPYEDAEWRLAHHMLQESGYSLPWIEKRKEIESGLEAARQDLARAWQRRQEGGSAAGWERAQSAFREAIAELNKKVFSYNLEVPSMQLQMIPLDAEVEIKRINIQERLRSDPEDSSGRK